MYPAAFDYHAPKNVKEALGLLGKLKDDAKILAGGHSLIPMMKLRLAQPKHLIDLGKVPGLSGIKADGKALVIGAMTTHWEVESSSAVKSKLPVLAEVASVIGDPAVRNKGTIGGSLAHADPAADWPAAMIALGAEMVCEGPKGKRKVGVDQWFLGLMATALKEREILVQVRVPLLPAGSGAAYMKFPHPASRFAVVGACAALTLDKQGVCSKAGVGVTSAGTRAVRANGARYARMRRGGTGSRPPPGRPPPGRADAAGALHGFAHDRGYRSRRGIRPPYGTPEAAPPARGQAGRALGGRRPPASRRGRRRRHGPRRLRGSGRAGRARGALRREPTAPGGTGELDRRRRRGAQAVDARGADRARRPAEDARPRRAGAARRVRPWGEANRRARLQGDTGDARRLRAGSFPRAPPAHRRRRRPLRGERAPRARRARRLRPPHAARRRHARGLREASCTMIGHA